MDLGLTGKIAIVAASSQGLGKASALALIREGAHVVICARNEGKLMEAAQDLKNQAANGAEVLPVVCDLTNPVSIRALVSKTISSFGTVHILVTNAGSPPRGQLFEHDVDTFSAAFTLNFISALLLCKECVPYMKKQNFGRIITIASLTAKRPIESLAISSCIRPSVVALTKLLAKELGPYNVTVNCICPGYFLTDPVKQLIKTRSKLENVREEDVLQLFIRNIPVGRMGYPEELGYIVAFLASEKAAYITGATIMIDGGQYEGI